MADLGGISIGSEVLLHEGSPDEMAVDDVVDADVNELFSGGDLLDLDFGFDFS